MSATQKSRVHAIIKGRVQGVCYRMETRNAAQRIGVTGWVRNLPDGSVEAVIEGDSKQIEAMLAWCRQGPAMARVDAVETTTAAFTGQFEDFRVTY